MRSIDPAEQDIMPIARAVLRVICLLVMSRMIVKIGGKGSDRRF